MRRFQAIAAMSLNRVIGRENRVPWRLPEDLRWFKQLTMSHAVVMGRKTFESIGRPLPGRTVYVLTRGEAAIPGVRLIHSLAEMDGVEEKEIFICGGEQVYRLGLPHCSDLYLTLVKHECVGDTFFPPFEHDFVLKREIESNERFSILHYTRPPA
jgi:dihydrofolate reductase